MISTAVQKILMISGSIRQSSTCMAILQQVRERHSGETDFRFSMPLSALPHFDPDAEENSVPAVVAEFRAQVAAAAGVIICTPEYVFSVPAILKNALEWCVASTVFSDKPTAMIVASGGGQKTYESLGLILKTIQCRISEETSLLFSGVRGRMRGQLLISDPIDLARLDALVANLTG